MLSAFKRVLHVGIKANNCLTSFRAFKSASSAKDFCQPGMRPSCVDTVASFLRVDSRNYSTSRSNLNLNLNVAKLKSKLEGEGFSSKEAELVTLECVKAIDDRLNTVANFRVDVQEIEKLKEVSLKLKFELETLQMKEQQLIKCMFRRSYWRMSHCFWVAKCLLESQFSHLEILFSEILSAWTSGMMVYIFSFVSLLAFSIAFVPKKAWLSFVESAGDYDSDDDLVTTGIAVTTMNCQVCESRLSSLAIQQHQVLVPAESNFTSLSLIKPGRV